MLSLDDTVKLKDFLVRIQKSGEVETAKLEKWIKIVDKSLKGEKQN